MAQLSDEDLREAAAEAGVTPSELRLAIARDGRNLPAVRPRDQGLMAPSPRGASGEACETALPYPPEQAVRAVARSIERRLGRKGHMQSTSEADILDEGAGVVYHVRAEADSAGGALVRVDIDPTPKQGRRVLGYLAIAGTASLFGVLGFVAWPAWLVAAAVAGGGTLALRRHRRGGTAAARALAAEAVLDAESQTPIGGAQMPTDGFGP